MSESRPPVEHVYFDPPEPQPADTWWGRYAAELTGLTDTSYAALEADCLYILQRGILTAKTFQQASWPVERVRTGLVMGSVQSGKTASMLGVSALAIDHGVDIIVVLAGTRTTLWRQTYERLTSQLDSGEETAQKIKRRLLCPAPGIALSDQALPLNTTYRMQPAQVRQRLIKGMPLIIVAMKQTDHLHALVDSLRRNVFDTVKDLGRPVRMLVLDDEADDGSILDAVVESSQDPIYGKLKQIPRAIANLWDPPQGSPENLFATYVAYTATPQANLLQEDHNPLAPRDFLVSLRTPLDVGQGIDLAVPGNLDAPRSSTYPEPAGIRSYYTGGEVFYRRASKANLCIPTSNSAERNVAEAMRAFLVAGAVRLYRSGAIGPRSAIATQFETKEDALRSVVAPHSMLYHPSATIVEQFRAAEDILRWAGVSERSAACSILLSGEPGLPATLSAALQADPRPWSAWLDRYQASADAIESEFGVSAKKSFPDWKTIEELLIDEIIPGTRIAVINSDPGADDRPSYTPTMDPATGKWNAARDVSTIFVSGNVMARGLTLEGMTTALFLRSSANPLADTQMQMQRWFGYRGSYIELCRVFASQSQLDLFRAYHDVDEAVRGAITQHMVESAPEPTVLQGLDFAATGKIANTGAFPLVQSSQPFVRVINSGLQPDPNTSTVARLFHAPSSDMTVGNVSRGRILGRPLELTEAADLLDCLAYDDYRPGSKDFLGRFWERIEARLNGVSPLVDPQLYRPPGDGTGDPARRACPYAIAAYLRLWAGSLTRRVPGLFVTGQPGRLWSYADLARKTIEQPRFWVGIRYGNGAKVSTGPLANLPFDIQATTKNVYGNELTTTWGANDPKAGSGRYRGDVYFDYYYHHRHLPLSGSETSWRPSGSDGQILFYINQLPGQAHPAVALGVCIPAGGPEQFSATRAGTATGVRSLP